MKGFKSISTNPYSYTQDGVWKKGQYTFQAVVLSDSGYAFAFQRADTTWQTIDLSWQVKEESYSKIQWTFTLEVDAVAFRLIANTVTGETIVLQPMLEKGSNGSTPIAHEEDLRGMDGDNHEFIFTRNTTGIAPDTPLSTQDDDYTPIDDSVEPPVIWTDNAQGVTKELPFEFVSMREKKNGVWLDFSPPSLWAKWGEDGLSVNLLVEGHYNSHWEGITKVVEIVGGVDVGGSEVVKVSAVFRKGEENIAATVSQSRGFEWYVNGVHLTAFDNQPFITLDETYGDGFADYVVLSYLVNSIREEERREIINISEGMDGIGEEFIFKANDSDTTPPVLPQTTDVGYQDDDYYGQGTANEWNDDPVAPTELNQFVWVAKRKKIGGEWQAFGVPSVWTKWVTDGEDGKDAVAPIIINGHWAFWDETIQDYVESAFSAIGDDGHSPYVDGNTGTWWEWDDANGTYQDTGVTAKGEDGDDAKSLILSASSLTMACSSTNVAKTGQTITVEAKLQNVSGTASFDATPYNASGAALTKITLGGSGNTRTLTNAQWLSTFQKVVITATLSGLSDIVTITRLSDGGAGKDSIVGLLTNENITLQATSAGVVSSFATANGEFWVYEGLTKITSGITFSKVSQTGCTAAITSAGVYSVSAMSADNATAVFRAVYSGVTIDKVLTLSKSRAGDDGDDGDPAKSIHLNPSAKAISITKGNIPVPTSVTVTGTAVNTTIQYWYYSANGATSFTGTAPTGVTRSGNQVTINSATAKFKTLSIKARNSTDDVEDVVTITRGGGAPYVDETTNTWWEWDEEDGIYTDTGRSPVGSDGRIPYPAGYYDSNKWYRREAEYAPYVQFEGALYLLIKDTPNAGIATSNTTYWKAFNNWQAVFVDSLVAAFAKIGGAVFTGNTDPSSTIRGRLISERGIDGTANFQNYTGDSGTWQPKLMLDFLNGRAKFEDAEVKGKITASSGSIGGMRISGDAIVSENGRLVIDGTNNTIYLLDDSGSIKTVIRPGDIPTSVSSYFSGSLNQNVSYSGIKGSVIGTTTKDSNTIFLSAGAYEVTIPSITLTASTTHTGGVGSSILSLKLVLSNGTSSNDILIAEALALSTGGEGYDQVVIPQTKKMITKSGTWRLRLISTAETLGSGTATHNGSLTSSPSTFNVSEIVNKSEIGSNGMMIATSINNYNFMVGDTFEVRRGNGGLQITNSGIKKWNGTSWVTATI